MNNAAEAEHALVRLGCPPHYAQHGGSIRLAPVSAAQAVFADDGDDKRLVFLVLTDEWIACGYDTYTRVDFDTLHMRDNSIPLMQDHANTRMLRLGVLDKKSIRVETRDARRCLLCSPIFSEHSPEAKRIQAEIKSGLPEQFSVGFSFERVEFNRTEYDAGDGSDAKIRRELTMIGACLNEVSVVNVGFDPTTRIVQPQ